MESTNLEIFVITLVAALVASYIGFIAKNIYEKYFSLVPKITISVIGKNSGGHRNFDMNSVKAYWNVTITFANISNCNAINLKIHYLNADKFKGSFSSIMYFPENEILRGFEKKDRFITYEKLINNEKIINRDKILSDFMASEIENLCFLLTFENEKRKKFYIEFKKEEARTYKWRKRRFKKYYSQSN
ncbi:MAG: hypothetical protein GZ094_09665 [Mariniphaga sp.]|nr:hypothetical protein [Mariniphaga sp.]